MPPVGGVGQAEAVVLTPIPDVQAGPNDMRAAVAAIVARFSTRIKDRHIFFKPAIPHGKLMNALATYATGVWAPDVLVLVDNTVFGGAKDGALLTPTGIYAHNTGESPQRFALADIESTLFVEGVTSVLYINDTKFLLINIPDKGPMRIFTEMLREIVKCFHPQQEQKSAAQALQELKALFDGGLITQAEYEQKRKEHLARL